MEREREGDCKYRKRRDDGRPNRQVRAPSVCDLRMQMKTSESRMKASRVFAASFDGDSQAEDHYIERLLVVCLSLDYSHRSYRTHFDDPI
jgi:hypothetical protein